MPTWNPIANVTLGSATTTVTFSSISQSYRDLVLVINGSATGTSQSVLMTLNGYVFSSYSTVVVEGNGSAPSSTAGSGEYYGYLGKGNAGISTNNWSAVVQFLDYASTTKKVTMLSRYGSPTNGVGYSATTWDMVWAIGSISLKVNGADFAAGTTFALYGVSA